MLRTNNWHVVISSKNGKLATIKSSGDDEDSDYFMSQYDNYDAMQEPKHYLNQQQHRQTSAYELPVPRFELNGHKIEPNSDNKIVSSGMSSNNKKDTF